MFIKLKLNGKAIYRGSNLNVDEYLANFKPVDSEGVEVPDYIPLTINDVNIEFTSATELNIERAKEVSEIIVTLADTVTVLDGDEVSQGRIARAILGLPDDTTTQTWIGANGDVYSLTKPKLQEALVLAGEAQTAIWVNYATLKAAL